MSSKQYRLQELVNPSSGLSLVVDTSNGLSLGALPGLENFEEAVSPVLPWADGIVTSPGVEATPAAHRWQPRSPYGRRAR